MHKSLKLLLNISQTSKFEIIGQRFSPWLKYEFIKFESINEITSLASKFEIIG